MVDAGKETAIYVVNKMIESDSVIRSVYAGKEVRVYPGYADEASDVEVSYPYIRYQYMMIPQAGLPWLRRDWVQYFVGDKDAAKVALIIERLIYLFDIKPLEDNSWPVPDPTGKFKIMDIKVSTGTIPNTPAQDNGVWEQGIGLRVNYTITRHSWGITKDEQYKVDALLS
jgi:hypothetical protein